MAGILTTLLFQTVRRPKREISPLHYDLWSKGRPRVRVWDLSFENHSDDELSLDITKLILSSRLPGVNGVLSNSDGVRVLEKKEEKGFPRGCFL